MRGHFRYLSFKTFPMTPRTPPMRGVLGLAVELWTFGSPGGLQILTVSKCWASPPHLAKVGLRQFWTKCQLRVKARSQISKTWNLTYSRFSTFENFKKKPLLPFRFHQSMYLHVGRDVTIRRAFESSYHWAKQKW